MKIAIKDVIDYVIVLEDGSEFKFDTSKEDIIEIFEGEGFIYTEQALFYSELLQRMGEPIKCSVRLDVLGREAESGDDYSFEVVLPNAEVTFQFSVSFDDFAVFDVAIHFDREKAESTNQPIYDVEDCIRFIQKSNITLLPYQKEMLKLFCLNEPFIAARGAGRTMVAKLFGEYVAHTLSENNYDEKPVRTFGIESVVTNNLMSRETYDIIKEITPKKCFEREYLCKWIEE